MRYAEVLVTLPVKGRFHYLIPPELQGSLQPGHRVLVPFGRRSVTAFVRALSDALPEGLDDTKLRQIQERMEAAPLVPADVLALVDFAASYYLAPGGEVLRAALPPGLTAASERRWYLSELGRARLKEAPGLFSEAALALLSRAAKGGAKQDKRHKKTATELIKEGLLTERSTLKARAQEQVELLERAVDAKTAWPQLKRARTRLRLFELLEAGPMSRPALEAAMGHDPFMAARRRMLKDGHIRQRLLDRRDPEAMRLLGSQDPAAAADPSRPALTEEQAAALAPIHAALDGAEGPRAFLLNGVTGSGKTEVYLQAIERALAQGKGAIVLVPEIALTPQLEARFTARFGPQVAVLHSGVPDAERRRRWFSLKDGEAKIALGARSALWAPVQRLGVVVVDEEHDASFKQSTDVRYNGRDLALTRAKQTSSVAILGSATPSLESLHRVEQGLLCQLKMRRRVQDRPLPTVRLIDLSLRKRRQKRAQALLSTELAEALEETLDAGQQSILFLNRRGFNTVVFCEDCGDPRRCPHCEVSLTYHRAQELLKCHYCGYQCPIYRPCPSCGSHAVEPFGAGTEQVEAAVKELLPEARVLRLDRDVTAKAGALEATLAAFRAHEADVLVGTQMVAKGHDFAAVTLVGILLADASLSFPDFRAAERTFQLLTQVAGRAGRAEAPGRVLIQTFQPSHYAIARAVHHDAAGFAELELQSRQEAGYPPYSRMGLIRIESKRAEAVEQTARRLDAIARPLAEAQGLRCLGPSPAPIERVRERWRYLYMLMSPSAARLVALMSRLRAAAEAERLPAELLFDVDPLDLL